MGSDRYSFLLRLWHEHRAEANPVMRGSLQRADSDRVQYFESMERLIEILRDATGAAPGGPAAMTSGQEGEGK